MIHRLRHSRHKVPVGCWDDLSQSESFLHRHWANSIMGRSLVLFPLVLLLVFCMETTVANLQEISVTHLDPFQLEHYRHTADKWLLSVNQELERIDHKGALLSWQMSTNRTKKAEEELSHFQRENSKFKLLLCEQHSRWVLEYLSRYQRRMMSKLCRGARLTGLQTKMLVETLSRLQAIYTEGTISVGGRNYTGESQVKSLMAESRNYSLLLQVWTDWRKAVGPPSRKLFRRMIEIGNMGARAAGYHDISEIWKEELGISQLDTVVDDLYKQIEPLYIQLYSFVRGRLAESDETGTIRQDRPLPAHVLGNMWAQSWAPLLPQLLPRASIFKGQETTRILQQRFSSFQELVELAQDFFLSLGFQPLPPSFWTRSQFTQPHDGRKTVCHGSATNFFVHQDVRLLMCGRIDEEDFYTLYHEMGHLYYFLAYRNQPQLFRSGANSAFHEAIGDTIVYAAMTTKHRQRLGFTSANTMPKREEEIVSLLRQALVKIPLLPFSLALEKWRWGVMSGGIKPEHYNQAWWDLKLKYQGIVPPIPRSESDFDPAAKFHIISNTPYIRYFLSGVLQVQMFDALCDASGKGPRFGQPLNQCDIYGSTEAGSRLWEMMSLGSSQPWNVTLQLLTRQEIPKLDAHPLLNYFRPLQEWLQSENRRLNYTIGF